MMDTDEHSLFTLDPPTDFDEREDVERAEAVTAVLVQAAPPRGGIARYEETYVEPVRRLRATLSDVLDNDTNPEREPAEALSMLKSAMDTFNEESAHWL